MGSIKRNSTHISSLINSGASLESLSHPKYKTLLVVMEVYRQQKWMYENKKRVLKTE